MQTVTHSYKNLHPVFNQIERLYSEISDGYRVNGLIRPQYYQAFKTLDKILYSHIFDYDQIDYTDAKPRQINTKYKHNEVVVCISGGKDSIACAKYFINSGYKVYLYHMRGINKVYADEYKAAKAVADYLNLPLYIDTVTLHGTQKYVEHPMKNMIVANGALHYALNNNISPSISFGTFINSSINNNPFDVCGGDCIEMWQAYNSIIQCAIPNAEIFIPLANNQQTFELIGCDTKLMQLSQSCISPQRFREHWRNRTQNTYKVKLWEHRCGCCWKCAMEYIYSVDQKLQDSILDYYLHCLIVLSNTLHKESGFASRSVQDVWEHYFFYDISKSIYGKELKDAVIQNKHIKFKPK